MWKFDIHFYQGSVGTHIRRGGQYIVILLEIYSSVTAKNYSSLTLQLIP